MNWKKWFGIGEDVIKEKAYVFEDEAALEIKKLYDARYINNKTCQNSYYLWKAIGKYIPEVSCNNVDLSGWEVYHTALRVFVGRFDDYSIQEILKKFEIIIIKDVK